MSINADSGHILGPGNVAGGQSMPDLQIIFNVSPEMLCVVSLDGRFVRVSPMWTKVLGWTEPELTGKLILDLVHPEDRAATVASGEKIVRGEDAFKIENRCLCRDGAYRWLSWNSRMSADRGWIFAAAREITHRRQPQEALRQSEHRYRSLFESMVEGLALCEMIYDQRGEPADFRYLNVNPAFAKLTGLPADQVVGRTVKEAIPGIEPFWIESYGRVVQTGNSQYLSHPLAALGKHFVVHAWRTEADKFAAVFSDVTEQWRTARQATRLAAIVESTDDAILSIDLESKILTWNKGAQKLFGYAEDEMVARSVGVLLPPKRRHELPHILERIRQGKLVKNFETVRVKKDGTCVAVSLTVSPLRNASGEIFATSIIYRDVTLRKRLEESLRAASSYTRSLIEASLDPLVTISPQGKITDVNQATEQATGVARNKLIGSDFAAYFTQPEKARQSYQQVLSAGTVRDYPLTIRHVSGQSMDVLFNATLYRDEGGRIQGIFATARDITDRRKLEDQLRQAHKMEAIGQLAGGVAHDFRNQLAVIKGYGEMLSRRSLVLDEGRDMLEEILKAAQRSTAMTAQLLAFSRKQSLEPRVAPLDDLVGEVGKLLPHFLGEDIQLNLIHGAQACLIQVDPLLFQQAIINLVTNARDAMPSGGKLTIATSLMGGDDVSGRHPQAKPGPHAVVSVTDTGSGMDQQTLAHIFEPFFTTKPVGKGTGLGLYMTYGFVQQSEGFIEIDSQPGQGTAFRLCFPRIEQGSLADAAPPGQDNTLPRGKERILAVEDEPAVRRMLAGCLREAGYTVVEAGSAEEASGLLSNSPGGFDLLITDVIMPGGSGADLVGPARRTGRDLPILYLSGYAGKELSRRGVALDPQHILAKPVSYTQLLQRVRQLLDKAI